MQRSGIESFTYFTENGMLPAGEAQGKHESQEDLPKWLAVHAFTLLAHVHCKEGDMGRDWPHGSHWHDGNGGKGRTAGICSAMS